jgi:hypothetical protein
MSSWLINGLTLGSALGLQLTRDTTWRMGTTNRRTTVTLPGIHGTINIGLPVYDEQQIVVDANVKAATEDSLEEAINQLLALCGTPTLTLTRSSGGITSTAAAELVSIAHDDWVPVVATHVVAIFAIPDAMFRGPIVTSDDLVFSGTLTAQEIASLSGASAPISDAVVRVTGPATSVTLTDPSSATGITWSGALAAGQYLFLRGRPLMARISSSATDWLSGGVSVLAAIGYPAAGRLQMFPVIQSATIRKIQLTASGTGLSGASRLCVQGRKAYL